MISSELDLSDFGLSMIMLSWTIYMKSSYFVLITTMCNNPRAYLCHKVKSILDLWWWQFVPFLLRDAFQLNNSPWLTFINSSTPIMEYIQLDINLVNLVEFLLSYLLDDLLTDDMVDFLYYSWISVFSSMYVLCIITI